MVPLAEKAKIVVLSPDEFLNKSRPSVTGNRVKRKQIMELMRNGNNDQNRSIGAIIPPVTEPISVRDSIVSAGNVYLKAKLVDQDTENISKHEYLSSLPDSINNLMSSSGKHSHMAQHQ